MTEVDAMRKPMLLIVDDEEKILNALCRALRKEAFTIKTATSPEDALEIVENSRVDIILSDNRMPGMTGLRMLSLAREFRPEVICFLITGWTESVPDEDLRAVGVRELFTKPWDVVALKRRLQEVRREIEGASRS